MNKQTYYVYFTDGDFVYTARDRVTGKEVRILFASETEAIELMLVEGYKQPDFEVYATMDY